MLAAHHEPGLLDRLVRPRGTRAPGRRRGGRAPPGSQAAGPSLRELHLRLIRLERVLLRPEALLSAMHEHLAIIEALRARDARQAVRALERHLTHARNARWGSRDQRPPWPEGAAARGRKVEGVVTRWTTAVGARRRGRVRRRTH